MLDFIMGAICGAFGSAIVTIFVLAAIYMSGENNNDN
jgi:hypothetical protein